jgi:hypothetical protein
MDESHAENLIERGLSAQRPRRAFRDRLLGDSTAVVVRVARARARWRKAGLALAAVLVGAVSFLGGRLSAPRSLTPGADPAPRAAAEREGVTVPEDLIAWLNAARLFKQLGMEDRMARAVERAGKLLPQDAARIETAKGRALSAADDPGAEKQSNPVGLAVLPRLYEPTRNINGIVAHSLGGHRYASERD